MPVADRDKNLAQALGLGITYCFDHDEECTQYDQQGALISLIPFGVAFIGFLGSVARPYIARLFPEPPSPYSRIVPGGGLQGHENVGGGHTLLKHVNVTDADLGARLGVQTFIPAAGRFLNRATAESSISVALDANYLQIQNWLANGAPLQDAAFFYTFRSPIGVSWVRGAAGVVPASKIRVVLRPDSSFPGGFRIYTSYPQV